MKAILLMCFAAALSAQQRVPSPIYIQPKGDHSAAQGLLFLDKDGVNGVGLVAPGAAASGKHYWELPANTAAGCLQDDGSWHLTIGSCAAAPSNMMTTNTNQNPITGVKVFTVEQKFQDRVTFLQSGATQWSITSDITNNLRFFNSSSVARMDLIDSGFSPAGGSGATLQAPTVTAQSVANDSPSLVVYGKIGQTADMFDVTASDLTTKKLWVDSSGGTHIANCVAGCASVPADMMTTDTAQTVTGVKTFTAEQKFQDRVTFIQSGSTQWSITSDITNNLRFFNSSSVARMDLIDSGFSPAGGSGATLQAPTVTAQSVANDSPSLVVYGKSGQTADLFDVTAADLTTKKLWVDSTGGTHIANCVAGCSSVPGNMMTTDTAQTVTGVKTFTAEQKFQDRVTFLQSGATQWSITSDITNNLRFFNSSSVARMNLIDSGFSPAGGSGATLQAPTVTAQSVANDSPSLVVYGKSSQTADIFDVTAADLTTKKLWVDASGGTHIANCVAGCSGAPPSNMMTTDTNQSPITGVKTFTVEQKFQDRVTFIQSGATQWSLTSDITNNLRFFNSSSVARMTLMDSGASPAGGSGATLQAPTVTAQSVAISSPSLVVYGMASQSADIFDVTASDLTTKKLWVDASGGTHIANCVAGCSSVPSNMMTTDTDQNPITGVKTFTAEQKFQNRVSFLQSGATQWSLISDITNNLRFFNSSSVARMTLMDSGASPAGGSGATLQAPTVTAQSVATNSPSLVVYGLASQTADIFDVKASDLTTKYLYVDSAGGTHIANCVSGCAAPANMVTTDTTQTITGQKTFSALTTFTGVLGANAGILTTSIAASGISQGGSFQIGSTPVINSSAQFIGSAVNVGFGAITGGSATINGNAVINGNFTVSGTCTGCAGAPANMVTTDTTQTISGAKTFSAAAVFNGTLGANAGILTTTLAASNQIAVGPSAITAINSSAQFVGPGVNVGSNTITGGLFHPGSTIAQVPAGLTIDIQSAAVSASPHAWVHDTYANGSFNLTGFSTLVFRRCDGNVSTCDGFGHGTHSAGGSAVGLESGTREPLGSFGARGYDDAGWEGSNTAGVSFEATQDHTSSQHGTNVILQATGNTAFAGRQNVLLASPDGSVFNFPVQFTGPVTLSGGCTGCGGAPADMMTTDTPQTVTAVKNYATGLEVSAAGPPTPPSGSVSFFNNGGFGGAKYSDGTSIIFAGIGTCPAGTFVTSTTAVHGGPNVLCGTPSGSAPSNMVTTDTNQTITGQKTFSAFTTFNGAIGSNGGILTTNLAASGTISAGPSATLVINSAAQFVGNGVNVGSFGISAGGYNVAGGFTGQTATLSGFPCGNMHFNGGVFTGCF